MSALVPLLVGIPLIGAAIIYIALLWPLVGMVARLERRFSRADR